MEYLKPIEALEQEVNRNKVIFYILAGLLAIAITILPKVVRESNPLLINTPDGVLLANVSPWGLSAKRFDQFTDAYLAARFSWTPETLNQTKLDLKAITAPQVMIKMKDSFVYSDSLAQTQKAKSFYVREDYQVSSTGEKIEIWATRILRIKNVGIATPLHLILSYQEAPITKENPYGIVVSGVEEIELSTESQ